MGLWATWSSGRCPCPWQGHWNWMICEVPSNPNHSMIPWKSMEARDATTEIGQLAPAGTFAFREWWNLLGPARGPGRTLPMELKEKKIIKYSNLSYDCNVLSGLSDRSPSPLIKGKGFTLTFSISVTVATWHALGTGDFTNVWFFNLFFFTTLKYLFYYCCRKKKSHLKPLMRREREFPGEISAVFET